MAEMLLTAGTAVLLPPPSLKELFSHLERLRRPTHADADFAADVMVLIVIPT